ncbi:MAG TPA: prepilin-type N-terminal cleavage/methylation domain-containing protein [Armatimonadota bacterium]|jgi:prepilin-type N-terminal cleavage/methylation domain-containing protein/prepilin-type processing-associated H-X9-DG protein
MRRGFTLIELLVVIAIIAILAAILFPVFARARAKALAATCLSNVKQLMLGTIMYASDNDDKFPRMDEYSVGNYEYGIFGRYDLTAGGNYMNDTTAPNDPTYAAVYPYLKNSQILVCPADSKGTRKLSYSGNGYLDGWAASSLNNVSDMIVMACESDNLDNYRFCNNGQVGLGSMNPLEMQHNSGSNMGYADGHAKWMPQDKWRQIEPSTSVNINPAL